MTETLDSGGGGLGGGKRGEGSMVCALSKGVADSLCRREKKSCTNWFYRYLALPSE